MELIELLRDDSRLLAVADAVATTQRPRARVTSRLLAVPLLAAALVAIVLFAPWQRSAPGLLDRALAAVGTGPVLHVVTEETRPAGWHLVNLRTGERTAPDLHLRTEIWYDPERQLEHSLTSTNGVLTEDLLETPDSVTMNGETVYTCAWIQAHPVEATRERVSCRLDGENGTTPRHVPEPPPVVDPGLTGFLDGYQDALQNGTARRVGEGTIDGRHVIWLEMTAEIPRPPGADRKPDLIQERVAIDSETYRPLVIRSLRGNISYNVSVIESVERGAADFSESKQLVPSSQQVAGGSVIESTEVEPAAARDVLGRPAFWAGKSLEGRELTKVSHETLRTRYERSVPLPPRESEGLSLEYGSGRDAILLLESTEPSGAYGWVGTSVVWPLPPEGSVRIGPFGAYLVRDGVYIVIRSLAEEDALIDAARALEPIPG
jgi:hypothetical protein